MKIQELGIIFIIIIIPISFILSIYTQFQIATVNLQTLYDTKLTSATFDAIKAFQINTTNSTTSDITNSKLRDIEASISTFKKSLMSTFELNGYKEEDLDSFIPALVYTMYDGFYIYAPFENVNYLKEPENIYGLRPYIPYSCRYTNGVIDVVITYSLDNYITIQGTINGEYVNDSGYLVDGIEIGPSGNVKYNGIEITTETGLKEYVGNTEYPYIKINGTKYYYNDNRTTNNKTDDEIFYLLNGQKTIQYKGDNAYNYYETTIKNNNLAKQYYKEAYDFTNRVRKDYKLGDLTFEDAYKNIIKDNGTTETVKIFEGDTRKIFGVDKNIEYKTSNFNQHRLEIIRNTIENNLSVAIANYNNYSGVPNVFQMPQLKEDEWDLVLNNISLISFVQGLNIGGKTYNGYTIVNNSESKELISEENIFIIGKDDNYHRIGDSYLTENNGGNITTLIPAGRVNLDFKRKELIQNTAGEGQSVFYYYPRKELASYNSIITQNSVKKYDDIYVYIKEETNKVLEKAFYTALGRERKGQYKAFNING